MGFRSFPVAVIVRAGLLLANCLLLAYVALELRMGITALLLTVLLAIQVWGLMRYIGRSNRDMARFLTSIRQDDFTQTFPDDRRGGTHRQLRRAFNEVLIEFRRVRAEREESFRYLNTIITHVSTGLLAVGGKGRIEFINPAAKRLLGLGKALDIGDLARRSESLTAAVEQLRPGERSLLRLDQEGDAAELSLGCTQVKIGDRVLKLISVHDIGRELDARELEAWQQLARVLNHEISNSVTPIASLAATARELLDAAAQEQIGDEGLVLDGQTLSDLNEITETIAQRSQGLVRFVEAYRQLTRLPAPRFRIVGAANLLLRIKQLLEARPELGATCIECSVEPEGLELTADEDLVEQALINIGINAIQALQGREQGTVELSARHSASGRILLQVTDNGPGLSQGALERVFVPFFTTKPGGTGIGLSLARQIARLHGGDISVVSTPDERTVFTLRF